MSQLTEVMARWSGIPGAELGQGPLLAPSSDIDARIERFLSAHPILETDPTYVEFQRTYAGASVQNPERTQIIDVLGFSDASTEIEEMDGPIVDDDGYLLVVDGVFFVQRPDEQPVTIQHAYAYRTSGTGGTTIYHSVVATDRPSSGYSPAFDRFVDLLSHVVATGGWLDPPGRQEPVR